MIKKLIENNTYSSEANRKKFVYQINKRFKIIEEPIQDEEAI